MNLENVFQKLTATMPPDAIEWRIQRAGKKNGKLWALCVPYADSRWLMSRLDGTVGPMNWWDAYHSGPDGGVVCALTIRVVDLEVTKEDAAENTAIESVKGGMTDAFKRACVKWNVGNIRALYASDGDLWADINPRGTYRGTLKTDGGIERFRWDPPHSFGLPAPEALPSRTDELTSAVTAKAVPETATVTATVDAVVEVQPPNTEGQPLVNTSRLESSDELFNTPVPEDEDFSIASLEEQAGVGTEMRKQICKRLGIDSPVHGPDDYIEVLRQIIEGRREQEA